MEYEQMSIEQLRAELITIRHERVKLDAQVAKVSKEVHDLEIERAYLNGQREALQGMTEYMFDNKEN